jgi:hypothetical protein
MHPINRQAEADYRQPGKDSDENAENKKKYFLVKDAIERGKQTARIWEPHV